MKECMSFFKMTAVSIVSFTLGVAVCKYILEYSNRNFIVVPKEIKILGNDHTLVDSDHFYQSMIVRQSSVEIAKKRFKENASYYQQKIDNIRKTHPKMPICFSWGGWLETTNDEDYGEMAFALIHDPTVQEINNTSDIANIFKRWRTEKNYVYRENEDSSLRDVCPFLLEKDHNYKFYRDGYSYFEPLGNGFFAIAGSGGMYKNTNSFHPLSE